jgi:hydroxyethylthiazole kinase
VPFSGSLASPASTGRRNVKSENQRLFASSDRTTRAYRESASPPAGSMDAVATDDRSPAWWSRRAWSLLSAVRARAPLVQCITNLVSMDIAANALLAAGASPAMVHSLREVPDFTPRCDAVYVNVGTLSEDWLPSMRAAASAGRPWVLDPVAAAASGFRMEACLSLLELRPAVVRGNGSEILALADRSAAASSKFKVLRCY